jgi:hypothetical protein
MKSLSKKNILQKVELEMMNKKVYMRIQKFKYLKFVPELNQTCPTDAPELTLFLNLVASKAFELFWTADPQ